MMVFLTLGLVLSSNSNTQNQLQIFYLYNLLWMLKAFVSFTCLISNPLWWGKQDLTVLSRPHTDKVYSDADLQASSSDSEDELMGQYQEAVSRSQGLRGGAKAASNAKHTGFSWESRQKYSPLTADYDGYSSEASADDGGLPTNALPHLWPHWHHEQFRYVLDITSGSLCKVSHTDKHTYTCV